MFSSFVGVCFAVKFKSTGKRLLLTGKSLIKFRKTIYGKKFHKPFSKTHSHRPLTPSLISVAQTHPPNSLSHKPTPLSRLSCTGALPIWSLSTFSHWGFADLVTLNFLALGLRQSGHWASRWAYPISLSPDCVSPLRLTPPQNWTR